MATRYACEAPYELCDRSLRALSCAAQGFGSEAIGGRDGRIYHVTTLASDGPGSLTEACKTKTPLWIVFEVSGTIHLTKYIRVHSFKTIDGRGQRIKLHGGGLQLKECEHVIICNLELEGGRGETDDGIQVKPNSKNIWIDRCTLSDYYDGLIDVTRASTNVTISRCKFSLHNKTMLLGADPTHTFDRVMRVTVHHCFFDGTKQRHPRVRFGKVHLYNNYTRGWTVYAVCSAVEAQVLSQGCIYEAVLKKKVFEFYVEKAPDSEHARSGSLRSERDLILGDGTVRQETPEKVFDYRQFYNNATIEKADERLREKIMAIAGWQSVALPPDCAPTASPSSSCAPTAAGPQVGFLFPGSTGGKQEQTAAQEKEKSEKSHCGFWSHLRLATEKVFDKG